MFEVSSFIRRFSSGSRLRLELAVLPLALLALGINLFLLYKRLADPSAALAGCGGGGCGELFASRWAVVSGVPVTVPGVLVWIGILASLSENLRRLRVPLAGAAAGAAFWFLFVQAVILGKFCPWCMTAHAAALAAAVLTIISRGRETRLRSATGSMGFWTYLGFLTIGLAQVYGPVPATHVVSSEDGSDSAALAELPVQWRGKGPKVEVFNGFKKLDAGALPHLGPLNARRVVVEYFDYTCPACRTMGAYFDQYRRKHPDRLCVILLPVPLERSCNRSMGDGESDHAGACEIARLALAVWRNRPEEFPALHQWLLEKERPAPQVRVRVAEILTTKQVDSEEDNEWINQLIAANIADWVYFSARQGPALPKVVGPSRQVLHGPPADFAEFSRIIGEFTGL